MYTKIHAYVLVPKSFMKFMFSTVYRVTQDFCVHPCTSMWASVVATSHIHRDITTFLDDTFPGRWIGRGSPTACPPPRSPDLTPLDIFEWGFIKDVVYSRKVRDLADLRQRTIEAVELITPLMLINTWQELEYQWI
jgi:hypothetical protein